MAEATTRFAHLLQPIRDLSKVWKIEIADELEKYVEEVAELIVTNPHDGITKLNFAEAALLIQGSTNIYSKKVELLYQLVYQALDLLALDKAKDAHGKKAKGSQSGLWAPIPETEELLTIDHLIKEGRNIFLDHGAPEQRQAMQRRVPLFLMPRDQADRRKKEFRISSCTVHRTGVYLLQESDAKLLDDLMMADDAMQGPCMDGPLVPAPPREVQDLDDRLQELLRDMPGDTAKSGEGEAKSPSPDDEEEGQVVKQAQTPAKGDAKTPVRGNLEGGELKKALPAIADPWALLDEHVNAGQNLPLEVGKTSKRLNAKKFASLESLPDGGVCKALGDDALWSGDVTAGVQTMLSAGHPVESLFLAVTGNSKTGGKYETQRAGFSAAWLEFEDLFAQANAKRKSQKMTMKAREPGAAGAADASDDEAASGDEAGAAEVVGATPMKPAAPVNMDAMTPAPEMTEEQLRQEEQRREVAMLENMIQDAQSKYESTIRQHLASMQKDSLEGDNRKFPQLYANVKRWEEQLAPVLKEFESRPEFDIHSYSNKFLAKLADMYKDGNPDKLIPFSRLVHGQPRYEVCRRFLTCLFLTNQGNTDIIYETEEERLNKFGIKLLKTEKKWISLEEEEAADAKAQTTGRGKKDAPEDGAAQAKHRGTKKAKAS